ncbi:hypothetical protein BJX63DRAFT_425838 [Aspergillus granulosus]|uniref:Uncharacterized protein n=1 Tax=Aspergillus granulosus TaxID=176169 RepID=A0ABR4GUX4_9EURO
MSKRKLGSDDNDELIVSGAKTRSTGLRKLNFEAYTVGWISPLQIEQTAALEMLDDEHEALALPSMGSNVYTLVALRVITSPAATVVTQMRMTFPNLRFCLLVGIAGGVPVKTDEGIIRLGDIVVSKPTGEHSGVIQYDHGKAEAGQFIRTGALAPPPALLLNAADQLASTRLRLKVDPLQEDLRRINTDIRGLKRYRRPGPNQDHLYHPAYVHTQPGVSCHECNCDPLQLIHRGSIASGESVIKSGIMRDRLAKAYNVLCFEMEAAGVNSDFPSLTIRGISDYSDSHKNNQWHGYAAAVAAAYARRLLVHVPLQEVTRLPVSGQLAEKLQQGVESIGKILTSNEKEKIFRWLQAPNPSTNYNRAIEARQYGTGLWFLESEVYKNWKENPRTLLCLRGLPGCGKTVLSASVIENVMEVKTTAIGVAVVYFYFDFSDDKKQVMGGMIRSILSQLAAQCSTYPSVLEDLNLQYGAVGFQAPATDLLQTLQSMFSEFSQVYLVLDALDECSERQTLFSFLDTIQKWEAGSLHMITTTRMDREIDSFLSTLTCENFELQPERINSDISLYVEERISTDPNLRTCRHDEIREEVKQTLMAMAGGMFRLISCHLDLLKGCYSKASLRRSLSCLPPSLEETYQQILSQIPDRNLRSARTLLQWVLFSARPLLLQEAADALIVDIDRTVQVDVDERFLDPHDILSLCPGLLLSVKERQYGETTVEIIKLAHLSVKEFLLSDQGCSSEGLQPFFIDKLEADGSIATVSLTYLLHFETYLHWMSFFDPEAPWKIWGEPRLNANPKQGLPQPLYCAALTGLTMVVETLIAAGESIEAPGSVYANALQAASAHGFCEIVLCLVKYGVDVNMMGGKYHTALQAACAERQVEVVEILLTEGADVNTNGGMYGTPLQAAASCGQNQIIKHLLSQNADINLEGGRHSTPLQIAAVRGYLEAVAMLIENGADITLEGGFYGTAFHAACFRGREQIVRLLIHAGADVNKSAGTYGAALQAAAAGGHASIGGCYGTAIMAAASRGQPFVMEHLAASSRACQETVELLLERGADGHLSGPRPFTNIAEAARISRSNEMIELLRSRGFI